MFKAVTTQLGRYEVVRELGRGLHGTAYLAEDPEIGRMVVVKVLEKGTPGREELSARLRAVSGLSHIGIAQIFDSEFPNSGGAPILVREFVEGDSLEALLGKGKLGQADALSLTLQVLDALSHAHSHNVCHHNLKPSNLIIAPDEQLKIIDFGQTRCGGVTAFLAPEQLKGSGDQRSDLFSVGVILYLMLSGYRPFQGNTDATIGFKLVHQHPVPVAAMDMQLSPEVDFVIGRLLAKNPEERYQTGDEARRDILRILESQADEPESARPSTDSDDPPAWLETVRFSARHNRAAAFKPEERKSRFRVWQLAIPAVALLLFLTTILAFRPMMTPVPSAPSINAHIDFPDLSGALQKTVAKPQLKEGHRERTRSDKAPTAAIADAGRLVAVPIELRHPFEECRMSIWVDEHLAYNNVIRGEKRSRLLHLGSSNAEYLTVVQMPTGTHEVKVEIRATDEPYDGEATVSLTFSKSVNEKLMITAQKSRTQLEVATN
ncbi:MAG: serine/threonine protein kinase [Acidobacteriaceae bacterium]